MTAQTPAQAREGANRIGSILKGPHMKTYIDDGDGPFIMVEPLQFIAVRETGEPKNWVNRTSAANIAS